MVDSDPYGLKILSVYMSGSKHMAYDSAHLTTPDIKWLGVSRLSMSSIGSGYSSIVMYSVLLRHYSDPPVRP
jgi:hypothetical protein